MPSIFNNPAAFAPFFDSLVAVEGKRTPRSGSARAAVFRSPIKACVIDLGMDDPLMDGSTGTNRRRWSVRVRIQDWPEVDPPQIGDRLHIPGEFDLGGVPVKAKVKAIVRHADDYIMEARSK